MRLQKHFLFSALALTLMATHSSAVPLSMQAVSRGSPLKTQAYIGAGLRYDSLDWNIASSLDGSTSPNILSELKWSDMTFLQIKAGGEVEWGPWYAEGNVATGFAINGRNQDSDYLGDNRTLEFSRSNNGIDGSKTYDYSVALGYNQHFSDNKRAYKLTPLVGYSHNILDLHMTDGYQTIPATGAFGGLDSTYRAEFKGPWVGINFETTPSDRSELNLRYEYHWYDYYAKANWNLRTDFAHPVSFEHMADGTGGALKGEYRYNISNRDELSFTYEQRNWTTENGTDRTYIVLPSSSVVDTRLNQVNWDSQEFMMNYKKRF